MDNMTAPPPIMVPQITAVQCERWGIPFALEEHPEIPAVPVGDLVRAGVETHRVVEALATRHRLVSRGMPKTAVNPGGDPLRYGWEPSTWKMARRVLAEIREEQPTGVLQVLIMGGWRSTKTEFCSKMFMETMVEKPGSRGWFLQQTEEASKTRQQPRLWKYFPSEWQNIETGRLKRGVNTKLFFSQGSGFANNMFVLPNIGRDGRGSEAEGKFYAAKEEAMQGEELDIAWADELIPAGMVKTLLGRLFNRNGLLLVSFTPIQGFTDTVKLWMEGAEIKHGIPCGQGVVEWADAELLPVRDEDGNVTGHERVPVVLRCEDPLKVVLWFHTKDNPYGNYPGLVKLLRNSNRDKILTEAYGIAVKKFGAVFQFREANIISDAAREEMLTRAREYTCYMVMDPAGTGAARNPFMQWWFVARNGQKICVREWPQPDDYIPGVGQDRGVWALDGVGDDEERGGSGADGRRGPGQEWFGFGLEGFSEEIARVEKELGITPHERYMDSRAANSTTMTSDGAVTLIQMWEALPAPHSLYFLPAAGRQNTETGETWKIMIQTKLEVSAKLNAPEIMVCACCRNTVDALKNWTGVDKERGARKDPVDAVKYFALEDATWIPATDPKAKPPTRWGGYMSR